MSNRAKQIKVTNFTERTSVYENDSGDWVVVYKQAGNAWYVEHEGSCSFDYVAPTKKDLKDQLRKWNVTVLAAGQKIL